MPNESIREKVLQALLCTLANIQSGKIIEACTSLPEPFFILMNGCDDQADIDLWSESLNAAAPTLNSVGFLQGTGAMNIGKTGVAGKDAVYEITLPSSVDATGKLGGGFLFVTTANDYDNANAYTIRIGTDDSNYWETSDGQGSFTDGAWNPMVVNIDADPAFGIPTVVGAPDKTDINYIYVRIRTSTGPTTIPLGDARLDFFTLGDADAWIPTGGASIPEVDTTEKVVGLASIAFGKLANAPTPFGLERKLTTAIDATGGKFSVWFYVQDKTELSNVPPFGYSLAALFGQNLTNYWVKFMFHDDINDVDNDLSTGWNHLEFDPLTEADFIAGSPDITAIDFVVVGAIGDSIAAPIETGNLRVDLIKVSGVDGTYHNDIKEVYRYKINFQQTPASPNIMFAALDEDLESKTYPIIDNKLRVSFDAEATLPDEAILDKELGKLAADIQIALATRQELWGYAKYVELKQIAFNVKKGTHTGILTGIIEVGFTSNQLDPTKQGL